MKERDLSKLLSLALRHQPETLNLSLDPEGWAAVPQLLANLQAKGLVVDMLFLEQVVANNDKKRFAFNADRTRIRANQGHSLPIDLGLTPASPPDTLYHGTAEKWLPAILKEGLQKQSRQHVHLSSDRETAIKVGQRHGKPVVLQVASGLMHRQGILFYQSENGVWLTEYVAPDYLKEIEKI
ncbi:RNA 2'-phosphotransferase [Nibribacter koreensis]|uniref:Probable RNA 2'-phosphotransferase n=1 Tax=Nibribacter koreensis TaxID=1084519 RepID=A0ABP8F592_9BACT